MNCSLSEFKLLRACSKALPKITDNLPTSLPNCHKHVKTDNSIVSSSPFIMPVCFS